MRARRGTQADQGGTDERTGFIPAARGSGGSARQAAAHAWGNFDLAEVAIALHRPLN